MKKFTLNLLLPLAMAVLSFIPGVFAGNSGIKGYDVAFNQVNSSVFTLDYSLKKYQLVPVVKNGVEYMKIQIAGNVVTNDKGWAELPYIQTAVQIGNENNVRIQVDRNEYVEYSLDKPLLPSRGVIYRNQDPASIPYEIDPASQVDEWYPVNLTENTDPYIIRDVRGTNVVVHAFQYNAVRNVLRVYERIKISVIEDDTDPINPMVNTGRKINKELPSIYESIFLNYNQNPSRWTNEVGEYGEMLVIYTSRDASVIQPWITWKKQKGYTVYESVVSTGTNVVSTVQTQFASHPDILYVQLVGDWADIKTDLGTSQNAPMDPMIGCVVGGDNYHDIMVGRFSASTTSHVTIQGDKAITYERDPDLAGTWYSNGLGIGSAEGAGSGDDGEMDQNHIDIIKVNKLVPFTYSGTVTEAYGASVATSTVSNAINNGVGVVNYCGHGDHTFWVTSNYSTTNVSSSTNGNKLPFVFSVACIVGEFHNGSDCLAEGMLRKSGGGAVATWMATINQPWTPPMRGQDYANDILIQGYNYSSNPGTGTNTTYGKTTFGAITFNAAELMIAEVSGTDDWDTYKTWTIFGDPSLQVRTKTPETITLSNPTVTPGNYSTTVLVGGSPFEGAIVSLYSASETQPYAAMTDASGNVSINHPFTGTVKLTVTGFNLATIFEDKVVAVAEAPICDFTADQTTITAGQSVQFTDISANYPSSWTWTFPGGNASSTATSNPVVTYNTPGTYDVTLQVTNGAGSDQLTKTGYIVVNPVTNPPVADFNADNTTIVMGGSVNFTDLSTNLPTSWSWTFAGGTPSTSTDQNPAGIVYDAPGTYSVTMTATNAYGNNTVTKNAYITVTPPSYCDAGTDQEYEYISNVSVGSISNPSNAWSSYTDYTAMTTDVELGTSYTMTIGIGQVYTTDNVKVWVDWNMNGVLDDAGEEIYTAASNGMASHSVTINVPVDATVGSTRMRIRLYDTDANYSPNSTPCGNSGYGEVEDYTLNVISPVVVAPVADFSGNPTTITEGGSVQFTDLSTNTPDTWSWVFESGTPATSSAQNPSVTYSTAGTYQVQLTASNSAGGDTQTKLAYITVISAAQPPVADFFASVITIDAGQTIDFTDISAGNPTSWSWSFDGGTPATSTVQNPTGILYSTAGVYQVALTVTNANGSDTETKLAYITVNEVMPAGFSLDFEACADYSQDFTPWTLVDGDAVATYQSSDCNFTGEGTAFSFMAFNPSLAGFSLAAAHGGDRCGMSVCPSDASQSDDWLISEQLSLGVNSSISFWVLSPKPSTWGNDTYEVLVSTTDNATGSFTVISGASPVEAPATWTQHTYDLSAYDDMNVFVAVHHVATDKFMFFIDDIEITTEAQINSPVADFTASETIICQGSETQFTNTSQYGGTYAWTFEGGTPGTSTDVNPAITYTTPGTYYVELVATNSLTSDTEIKSGFITVSETPVLSISGTDESSFGASDGYATANVSGGASPYTYYWETGQTTATAANLTSGTYSVTVVDANGVCTVSDNVSISYLTSAEEMNVVKGASVYPNPSDGMVTVIVGNEFASGSVMNIYDITGKQLVSVNMEKTVTNLDLRNLSSGIYMIEVSNGKDNITKRLVIE